MQETKIQVDISRAVEIPGWMNITELAWLAFQASQHSNIAEIGSFLGRSTRALVDNTPGDVHAIDLWQGAEEYKGLLGNTSDEQFFSKFKENLIGTDVYIHRMSSLDAAKYFSNEEFDMVFIDAAHDYASVRADIQAWKPLVHPGGLLCGHDFKAEFPGVTQAVLELLPQAQLIAAYTSIWGVEV